MPQIMSPPRGIRVVNVNQPPPLVPVGSLPKIPVKAVFVPSMKMVNSSSGRNSENRESNKLHIPPTTKENVMNQCENAISVKNTEDYAPPDLPRPRKIKPVKRNRGSLELRTILNHCCSRCKIIVRQTSKSRKYLQ